MKTRLCVGLIVLLCTGLTVTSAFAAAGKDASKPPPEGATKLLISSIEHQDLDGVKIAFKQGADANVGDKHTPIHLALQKFMFIQYKEMDLDKTKLMAIVKFLFIKGAHLKNDNEELFCATISNDKDLFAYLLAHGLDPHGTYEGYSLVQLAYIHKADSILPLLYQRGVHKITDSEINHFNLLRAITKLDSKEITRLITKESVDLDFYDPSGRTPLLLILGNPGWAYLPACLSALLAGNPNWDLPSKYPEDFGRYPIHFVCSQLKYTNGKQLELVSNLLAASLSAWKANPNVVDELKSTPLHYAATGKSMKAVKLLIQYGASAKAIDYRFRRPSVMAESPEIRDFLLEQEKLAIQ
jgi:hypothetical protein